MYSCGHDSNGERNFEYENLLPHQRMAMSSGQCPKCLELRDNLHSHDWHNVAIFESGGTQSPKIIGPDPEILKIARLFLEKYEVLSEKDRSAYSGFISCLMNPPLVWKREEK